MRTACFVDGYNVYYGLVHGTAFKWLDLTSLIEKVLRVQSPQNSLAKVYYFTSPVLPQLASNGVASHEAHAAHHLAHIGDVAGMVDDALARRSGWAPHEADAAAQALLSLWRQHALDLEHVVPRAVMAIACGLFGTIFEEA